MYRILAINPGSTSTKFAVYFDEKCVLNKTLRHSVDELAGFTSITDQFDFRKGLIIEAIQAEKIEVDSIKFIIGRGGLTYPLESGVYRVNNLMLDHVRKGVMGQHASNLGPLLADYISLQIPNAQAFIADPVVTDELQPLARISGHPKFERRSIFHALNQKATARNFASDQNKTYEDLNLIVVHLGGGISVGAHKNGRVIDVNNALDGEGPFSPERSGTLPVGQLIDYCFSGKYTKDQLKRMVVGEGGYVGHLGTNDARKVEEMAGNGIEKAVLIQDALCYQVSKMIGEMAVVLNGKIDAIILTGGLAFSNTITNTIRSRVGFLSEVHVYPGEDELEALAMNALRVARGDLVPRVYAPKMG